jgi:tetraacyldisaccharide 4'-kinase
VGSRVFPDHHAYTRNDIADLIEWASQLADGDTLLVTTHKDLVKIRASSLGGNLLYALRVEMRFLSGAEQLQALVRSKTLLV